MRAAFTSVPRAGGVSYIGATLESLRDRLERPRMLNFDSLSLAVFSDSIERPPNVPVWVHVECRTPDELAAVQAEQLVNGRNQIRALRWVEEQGDGLVLTFEDDIEFAHDWLDKALRFASHIPEASTGEDFVFLLHNFEPLALGDGFDPVYSDGERTVFFVEKDYHCIGAQAVLMPARTAGKIADAMEQGIANAPTHAEKCGWAIADQGIIHYCQSRLMNIMGAWYTGEGRCNLYTIVPCLVRHVGEVSAWSQYWGALTTQCFKP